MLPCLCACALVCLRQGDIVAHLLAPLLVGFGARGAGKCVPGAPGPGTEAEEPDTEPAVGDVDLGSQPPCHKDKLHCPPAREGGGAWHGWVRPAILECLRHRWCYHVGWVWLPMACWAGLVTGHPGAAAQSGPAGKAAQTVGWRPGEALTQPNPINPRIQREGGKGGLVTEPMWTSSLQGWRWRWRWRWLAKVAIGPRNKDCLARCAPAEVVALR